MAASRMCGTITDLGAGIRSLALLANDWLERTDPRSQELLKSARLTSDVVTTALAAAEALTQAGIAVTLDGTLLANDSPATNCSRGG